jgi:hypothetical protein
MNSKQLLAMASRRQWMEVSTLLSRPENHGLASELMPQLEELGDRAAASRSWTDAANHYQAAILCGTLRRQDPDMHAPLFKLSGKLNDSMRQFMEEHARDESGPLDWGTATGRIIELAHMHRLQEADALLRRLDQLDDPDHAGSAACGHLLEEEADKIPARQRDLGKWFCERSLSQFKKAESAADMERLQLRLAPPPAQFRKPIPPRPPAPPPIDLDDLVGQLSDLARDRRRGAWIRLLQAPEHKALGLPISERFEALADTCREKGEWFPAVEFYTVASKAGQNAAGDAARIGEKIRQMTLAIVDQKISHPLGADITSDPLDWDHGWDLAESLALAGRFADADALLIKLQSVPDDHPYRGYELPGRFESLGDYLLPKHPELARWFYEMFRESASNLPADTAYEGYQRRGIVDTAVHKVADANARLPRRIARVQVVLGSLGQGPRPDPEIDVRGIENNEVLKLVPNRELFTRRPCRGGSELVPPEALHRYYFRVRIEGREVRLFPEQDEYGRMQPFAFEPPPFISVDGRVALLRVQIGKPVVICYNVPGGGPAWTLTLTDIAEG